MVEEKAEKIYRYAEEEQSKAHALVQGLADAVNEKFPNTIFVDSFSLPELSEMFSMIPRIYFNSSLTLSFRTGGNRKSLYQGN
mgnify:CR=1 FL=1